MPSTPRYAIVIDDHPVVARGMEEFLKTNSNLDAVYSTSHTDACLALIAQHGPAALVIVDFWLPEQATPAFVAQLCMSWPQTAVLVVSGDDDPAIQAQARACGAHGFLLKHEAPDVFNSAVNGILGGIRWFYPHGPARVAPRSSYELTITCTDLGLSARQGQVLALLLHGMPNKSIAAQLSVTENTVKEHVTGILHKLGVRNRVEAITKLRGRKLVNE